MPPFDHRQPGLIGALLADHKITAGMILDGIHLHPMAVNFAWQVLGSKRTNLVTDATAALGMPPGEYHNDDITVYVDDVSVRLADGHLAGSLLSLDQALRNLVTFTGCSLEAALPTVTHIPAHLLGLDASHGKLVAGAQADFVFLDTQLRVTGMWVNGQQIQLDKHATHASEFSPK
jgi:N-acetylglucosamine-6-phosphate deacetylase